jgi:Lysyl oxidase
MRRPAVFALLFASVGCTDGENLSPLGDRGALIETSMESRVGVLLDELPAATRDRAAAALLAEPTSFWLDRARRQVRLTRYRLVFRKVFHPDKGQLPLPPEEVWKIALDPAGPRRVAIGGHDVVAVDYAYSGTILSDRASPPRSEPALAEVGGAWDEPYVLPVDPELLLQRTGYACMNEREFPPNSVDAENVDTFYDHECTVAPPRCHVTHPLASEDCKGALAAHVGGIETRIHFARVAYGEAAANAARVGTVTHAEGADLAVRGEGLDNHRIIYRYIPGDSCAIVEGCVGGPGWRRLLQFDASVKNVGGRALDIGDVDYYISGKGTSLDQHHIYEYSACHRHYHFSHYGDFTFGAGQGQTGQKRAFCLQSTSRYANHEASPLVNPYGTCSYQGIAAGWGDDYGAGLECQWIDVTAVDTSKGPVTEPLRFLSNPDRFLCEGTPVLDAEGRPTFERTSFTTAKGEPVDRPRCDFVPGFAQNNLAARPVTLPPDGGLTTAPCTRGQIGPLRDCGLTEQKDAASRITCAPGAHVKLSCSIADPAVPQMVRVCERSHALDAGVACTFRDALGNAIIAGATAVELTCPPARDAREPGGAISLYSAPVLPEDEAQPVACAVSP